MSDNRCNDGESDLSTKPNLLVAIGGSAGSLQEIVLILQQLHDLTDQQTT
jgi:hypothetical protein